MAIAMASSYYDRVVAADLAIVGEVGVSGEIRTASQLSMRLNEAAKIGFRRALVPKMRRRVKDAPKGLKLIEVSNLAEALREVLPGD